MLDLGLTPTGEAITTLIILVGMFILFLRETYPTEVVAIGAVGLLLITGLLPYSDGLAVLSNPAPWTIAAMFIVMGALVRTGSLDRVTRLAESTAKTHPKIGGDAVAWFCGFGLGLYQQHAHCGHHDPDFRAGRENPQTICV